MHCSIIQIKVCVITDLFKGRKTQEEMWVWHFLSEHQMRLLKPVLVQLLLTAVDLTSAWLLSNGATTVAACPSSRVMQPVHSYRK